jgi:NADPH2:quinone reductase
MPALVAPVALYWKIDPMKAMVMTDFGGPEVLTQRDVPVPEPASHQIRARVHACGTNPVDYKVRRGGTGARLQFPFILGWDVSGVVDRVGSEVTEFRPGDEVYFSGELLKPGGYAEYAVTDARVVYGKPANLSHVEAASLPLVSITAWEALIDKADIEPGETVLIHAGGGGVGSIAIQLVKWRGCRVWTTASRPESQQLARELGADEVINYQAEDFVEAVRRLSGDRGVPVIFDAVGGDTFSRSFRALSAAGRLVTCVESEEPVNLLPLFLKSATLFFEFMGVPTLHGVHPEHHGDILCHIGELVEAGTIRPVVSQVLPLEEAARAHQQLETGHTTGKIVLQIVE